MKKNPLRSVLSDSAVLAELRAETLDVARSGERSETIDVLLEGGESGISEGPYSTVEAIILLTGRPALLVQGGKWESPRSKEIRARLEPATDWLLAALPKVGRIEIVDYSMDYIGTGWMIDEDILVTNRHVGELFAMQQGGSFGFRLSPDGKPFEVRADFLREHGSDEFARSKVGSVIFLEERGEVRPDMALVRLVKEDGPLPEPIELDDGSVDFRDNIAVIGYPAEDPRNDAFAMRNIFKDIYGVKRLSPGWVMGVRSDGRVLEHDCTTLGGNSGSVVINLATGKACGLHFAGSYRDRNLAVTSAALRARLAEIGRHFFTIGEPATGAVGPDEIDQTDIEAERRRRRQPRIGRRDDSSPLVSLNAFPRDGYDPEFLRRNPEDESHGPVPMPEVTDELQDMIGKVQDRDDGELKYTHFSVMMRGDRRLAFFTACNIDGNSLYNVPRVGDRWFHDHRLADPGHQIGEDLYRSNALDRGHLVRRLDPGWGSSRGEAAQAIADTFFFTNCSPQHSRLNQRTWLSLEDYILSNAATHDLKVSVFTGPVFGDRDRRYRNVRLPEEYWKVVVIINSFTGRLSATAYLLSQTDYLRNLEFAYGEFRTYQRSVREIEKKTGLLFGNLSLFDPLGMTEAPADREILSAEDIVL